MNTEWIQNTEYSYFTVISQVENAVKGGLGKTAKGFSYWDFKDKAILWHHASVALLTMLNMKNRDLKVKDF